MKEEIKQIISFIESIKLKKKEKVTYGKAQVLLIMRGEFFQGELINNTSINH